MSPYLWSLLRGAVYVFPVALTINDLVGTVTYVQGASMQVRPMASRCSALLAIAFILDIRLACPEPGS
jgi:hypothetical protein